jgi:prepilin-type N-terminal cleavage/methylation domain-containing protein
MKNKKHSCFTLIEMLVAIAIICVLAGFLYMAIDRGVSSSRELSCTNNLKQVTLEWQIWGKENPFVSPAKETSPQCMRAEDKDGNTWADHIGEKLGDEVFYCPSQEKEKGLYGYGLNPLCGGIWSYTMGMMFGGFILTPEHDGSNIVSMVYKPEATVIFCDSGYISDSTISLQPEEWEQDYSKGWKPYVAFSLTGPSKGIGSGPSLGYNWGNTLYNSGIGSMGWNSHYRAVVRHIKVPVAMVDGHAEAIEIDRLVNPQWGDDDCLYDNYSD